MAKITITELNPADEITFGHEIPSMKDGETEKINMRQAVDFVAEKALRFPKSTAEQNSDGAYEDEDVDIFKVKDGDVLINSKSVLGKFTNENLYNHNIVANLPLNWADLGDAPSATFWYPQGFAFDSAGWLLIHYAGVDAGENAIIVYNDQFQYVGWFRVPAGGESIVAIGSFSSSDLKLYKRVGSALHELTIGAMPASGTDLTAAGTVVIASGVGLQFSYDNSVWLVEQSSADLGVVRSRTKWNRYNENFEYVGFTYIPVTVIGYENPTEFDLYLNVPKSQGVALIGGQVAVGVGGSWIPASDGVVSPEVASLGLAVVSSDGSLLYYGVLRADKTLADWQSQGITADRTENEGIYKHPDGSLYLLNVCLRPSSTGADVGGLLVTKVFDPTGRDMQAFRSDYNPSNLSRLTNGLVPRHIDGGFRNPLTQQNITTLSELLDLMQDMQLPRMTYYTASVNLTPLPTMTPPDNNYLVEIVNMNNETFNLKIARTTADPWVIQEYLVFDNVGIWEARKSTFNDTSVKADRDGVAQSGDFSSATKVVMTNELWDFLGNFDNGEFTATDTVPVTFNFSAYLTSGFADQAYAMAGIWKIPASGTAGYLARQEKRLNGTGGQGLSVVCQDKPEIGDVYYPVILVSGATSLSIDGSASRTWFSVIGD